MSPQRAVGGAGQAGGRVADEDLGGGERLLRAGARCRCADRRGFACGVGRCFAWCGPCGATVGGEESVVGGGARAAVQALHDVAVDQAAGALLQRSEFEGKIFMSWPSLVRGKLSK